jgi:hypothetical protein
MMDYYMSQVEGQAAGGLDPVQEEESRLSINVGAEEVARRDEDVLNCETRIYPTAQTCGHFGIPLFYADNVARAATWAGSQTVPNESISTLAAELVCRQIANEAALVAKIAAGHDPRDPALEDECTSVGTYGDWRFVATNPRADSYDDLGVHGFPVRIEIRRTGSRKLPECVWTWVRPAVVPGEPAQILAMETFLPLENLRVTDDALFQVVCSVLALRTHAGVDGRGVAGATVPLLAPVATLMLHSAPLKSIKAAFKMTAAGTSLHPVAKITDALKTLPLHILSTHPVAKRQIITSRDPLHITRATFYKSRSSTSGITGSILELSASALPVCDVVYLGTNGGKAVTGVVSVVRSRCAGTISYLTQSAHSLGGCLPRKTKTVLPLVSKVTTSLASMYQIDDWGTAVARLRTGDFVCAPTIVRKAMFNCVMGVYSRVVVAGPDTAQLEEATRQICEAAGLQCWLESPGVLQWRCSHRNLGGSFLFVYGAGVEGPWAPLLSRTQPANHPGQLQTDDSHPELDVIFDGAVGPEAMVDVGLSGLGRWLFQDFTQNGALDCRRFYKPRASTWEQDAMSIVGVQLTREQCVVDIEYLTLRSGDRVNYVPVAVGVATFGDGELKGQGLLVAPPELVQPYLDSPNYVKDAGADSHKTWETLTLGGAKQGDIVALLRAVRMLRIVAAPWDLGMYGKGVDNDNAIIRGAGTEAVVWPKAQGPDYLADLGAAIPKYDALAKSHSWSIRHNPAAECLLFGHTIGLWAESRPREPSVSDYAGADDIILRLAAEYGPPAGEKQ